MPAAAKPMGMIMDVTVSCGEGGREAAVRRSAARASSFFFWRNARSARFRVRSASQVDSTSRGRASRARGFCSKPPVKRGRGRRTSDEPRKWTYPFAAWMACVFDRGDRSARGRGGRRARAGSEGSAFRVCTMPSRASPRISLLGLGGPRGGSTEPTAEARLRTFWAAMTF